MSYGLNLGWEAPIQQHIGLCGRDLLRDILHSSLGLYPKGLSVPLFGEIYILRLATGRGHSYPCLLYVGFLEF